MGERRKCVGLQTVVRFVIDRSRCRRRGSDEIVSLMPPASDIYQATMQSARYLDVRGTPTSDQIVHKSGIIAVIISRPPTSSTPFPFQTFTMLPCNGI